MSVLYQRSPKTHGQGGLGLPVGSCLGSQDEEMVGLLVLRLKPSELEKTQDSFERTTQNCTSNGFVLGSLILDEFEAKMPIQSNEWEILRDIRISLN